METEKSKESDTTEQEEPELVKWLANPYNFGPCWDEPYYGEE